MYLSNGKERGGGDSLKKAGYKRKIFLYRRAHNYIFHTSVTHTDIRATPLKVHNSNKQRNEHSKDSKQEINASRTCSNHTSTK